MTQRVFVVDAAHPEGYWTGGGSAAARPHGTRPRPRTYVNRPKPVRPPHKPVVDPFRPMTDAEINARADAIMQSGLGPTLKMLTDAIESRSRAGQAAIAGTTSALGGLLRGVGPDTQAIYDRARSTEQATAGQLNAALGSFGEGIGSELQGKLALQNAPAAVAADTVGGAVKTAQGAGNAGLATQTAESQMLNTQGAAAGAYGAKLPGIAALMGMQHSRDLESQLSSELTKALSDARSGAQDSRASILMHLLDNEIQKGAYRQSGLFNEQKLAQQAAEKARDRAFTAKQKAYDRSIKMKQLGITAERVAEYARHNGVTEAVAEAKLIQAAARAKETRRHNRAAEAQAKANEKGRNKRAKNKGKGGKPWDK